MANSFRQYAGLSALGITAIAGFAALVLAMLLTSPIEIGPIGVTVWFVVLAVSTTFILAVGLFVVKHWMRIEILPSKLMRSSLRQGFLGGLFVASLLALSTLRQLSIRDAILAVILVVLLELYFRNK